MLASVTRLRVRSGRFLPSFLWRTFQSQRQLKRAPGFLGGRILIDSGLTFWTLTTWQNEESMRKFRSAGPHARVMPRLAEWCNEATYAHWIQSGDPIPTWQDAYERLSADGRLSRVLHPSKAHSDRQFARPRLKPMVGQDLKPRV
jgi:heme-degrading monooxygenase HmoA